MSFRLRVAAFAVVNILVCFGVGFLVAVTFPEPAPQRLSVADAAAIVQSGTAPAGWRRDVLAAPPFPAVRDGPGLVIGAGLAATLGLAPDAVRARPVNDLATPPSRAAMGGGAPAQLSDAASAMLARMALSQGMRFAPFEMAIRRSDGAWVHLRPDTPWLTPSRARMLAAFALAAAILMPFALWAARALTAPFQRLAEVAADDARVDSAGWVGGPPEAVRAAGALDAMRARLLDHLRTRTAMMAAIAHDLRTPLTALRLRVEGLSGDAPRAEAVAEIARMERMIAQLLTYVRGEEAPWITEPVDLADVLRECVGRCRESGGNAWMAPADEALVLVDRDQLDRALGNLIDNAVLHGGQAQVRLSRSAGTLLCTIDDDGPGMAPDAIEAAFLPFHRGEPSRNRDTGGTGLGLAIARSILTRAGGVVLLENRPTGGLRATVRLPSL
jgi:two-component system OmpR family sensor kinase